MAGSIAAILLMGTAWFLPFARAPWGEQVSFPAAYLTVIVVIDGLIALFLSMESLAGGASRAIPWIAGGYVFVVGVATANLLTFPGVLNRPLVTGEGSSQLPVWLWVLWRIGFPCFLLIGLWARQWESRDAMPTARLDVLAHLAFPVGVGFVAGLALPALMVHYAAALPVIFVGQEYSRLSNSPITLVMLGLNVGALAVLAQLTRLRTTLTLGLAVAQFALILEIVLALVSTARYSAGWYVSRWLGIASALAVMVALVIRHFAVHRRAQAYAGMLEHEVRHDALTGLYNRRHLVNELREELGRAKRYRHPLSILMVDIDHFKRINDQQGHLVGDQCIKAVAQTLQQRAHRSGDFAARFGGEEFVVVLPETPLDAAVSVAEAIRQQVAKMYGEHASPAPVTVSIGAVAAELSKTPDIEHLLQAADECLYEAKRQGRNRVMHAHHPGESCGIGRAA